MFYYFLTLLHNQFHFFFYINSISLRPFQSIIFPQFARRNNTDMQAACKLKICFFSEIYLYSRFLFALFCIGFVMDETSPNFLVTSSLPLSIYFSLFVHIVCCSRQWHSSLPQFPQSQSPFTSFSQHSFMYCILFINPNIIIHFLFLFFHYFIKYCNNNVPFLVHYSLVLLFSSIPCYLL